MKKEEIANKVFNKIKEEITEEVIKNPKTLQNIKENGAEEIGKIAAKATVSAIKDLIGNKNK